MHDNDGQVTPVSQAFSVWTLEGLSTRTGELEALLELVSDYGEFKGETGNALAAILRLIHELQDATVHAIARYKEAPGAINYTGEPIKASEAPEVFTERERYIIDLYRGMNDHRKEFTLSFMLMIGGDE